MGGCDGHNCFSVGYQWFMAPSEAQHYCDMSPKCMGYTRASKTSHWYKFKKILTGTTGAAYSYQCWVKKFKRFYEYKQRGSGWCTPAQDLCTTQADGDTSARACEKGCGGGACMN